MSMLLGLMEPVRDVLCQGPTDDELWCGELSPNEQALLDELNRAERRFHVTISEPGQSIRREFVSATDSCAALLIAMRRVWPGWDTDKPENSLSISVMPVETASVGGGCPEAT